MVGLKMDLKLKTPEVVERWRDKTIIYGYEVWFRGRRIADIVIRKQTRVWRGIKRRVYEVWDSTGGMVWSGLALTRAQNVVRKQFMRRKRLVGA